jgi:hypothetical protein
LSLVKLKKLKKDIENLIDVYDSKDIIAPIPNLEEACECLESAIEEMTEYKRIDDDEDE